MIPVAKLQDCGEKVQVLADFCGKYAMQLGVDREIGVYETEVVVFNISCGVAKNQPLVQSASISRLERDQLL